MQLRAMPRALLSCEPDGAVCGARCHPVNPGAPRARLRHSPGPSMLSMLPPTEEPRVWHLGGFQPGSQWQFFLLLHTCQHQGGHKPPLRDRAPPPQGQPPSPPHTLHPGSRAAATTTLSAPSTRRAGVPLSPPCAPTPPAPRCPSPRTAALIVSNTASVCCS